MMTNQKIIGQNQKAIGFVDVLVQEQNNPAQGRRSIRGTGFVVSEKGIFVTNAHVYLEIPENEKKFIGFNLPSVIDSKGLMTYARYSIELLKLDKENDLALFKIIAQGKNTFETVKNLGSVEKVQEGEEILILGHPLATELLIMGFGITPTANQCIVSAIKRKAQDGSLDFFLVDTHINLGSSGSPIFSKASGDVIGIASGRIGMKIPLPNQQENKGFEIPANIGVSRPVDYLKKLIKTL